MDHLLLCRKIRIILSVFHYALIWRRLMTESSLFVRYVVNINNIAAILNRMGWHAAFTTLSDVMFLTSDKLLAMTVGTGTGCVWVSSTGGEFSARICHSCLQRCNIQLFSLGTRLVLWSPRSCLKSQLYRRQPCTRTSAPSCLLWKMDYLDACCLLGQVPNTFTQIYLLMRVSR